MLEPQEVIRQMQEIAPSVDLSQFPNIRSAFIYVTSYISKLLQNGDFYAIKRSCIEQILTPNGAQLSPEMVQEIKATNNLNDLLDVLTISPYWSWLDLRLLESMVVASGSVVAINLLTNYNNFIYSKKLLEVLPSFPNREFREAYHSKLIPIIRKDLEEITIADLLKHRSELETVIMDLGRGILTLQKC